MKSLKKWFCWIWKTSSSARVNEPVRRCRCRRSKAGKKEAVADKLHEEGRSDVVTIESKLTSLL